MRQLEITLTDDERNTLEYKLYLYTGSEIAVNHFVESNYEFSMEHLKRIVNSFVEKYKLFIDYILYLIEDRFGKKVEIQDVNFEFHQDQLNVYLK